MAAHVWSPLRAPWMATMLVLVLLWCLWGLEMPSSVSSTVKIYVSDNQVEDDATRAQLEAISDNENQVPTIEAAPTKEAGTTPAAPAGGSVSLEPASERPLILYAYSESDNARINLEFFIAHGLHAAADFVFILNGETDVAEIIPDEPNIRYVQRVNDCYDLGAYAEVLTRNDFYKQYKKFIMLNASIRGPFVPYWSESCWTDMYLRRVTDEVKLVGMTSNCWPTFHVQSMIWATDIIGLSTLLFPSESTVQYLQDHPVRLPPTNTDSDTSAENTSIPTPTPTPSHPPGINGCFHTWNEAVAAEVSSTSLIKAAGYKVDVMMSAFHGDPLGYGTGETCEENGDVLFDGQYFGTNVHPFETLFMKSNRDVDPVGLQRHSEWVRGRGYSSYDYCRP